MVEGGVGHGCLDQPFRFGFERGVVGEGQTEGVAGLLDGGLGVAGVPDGEAGQMVANRGGLGVGAHDPDRGDQDPEGAGAVVGVECGDVHIDPVGAADFIVSGRRMVMNTCRPPLRLPAVSKMAPDSSASVLRKAAWSSFCIGV